MTPLLRKIIAIVMLALVIGIPCWILYRQVKQSRLDRALIAAIKQNNASTIDALLAQGADPNTPYLLEQPVSLWQKFLARFQAKHSSKEDRLTALLAALGARPGGADHYVFKWEDTTLLHVTKQLLDYGADPNIPDQDGCTPLMLAVRFDGRNTVRLLIQHGAQVDRRDRHHQTALLDAVQKNPELVKTLLEAHADPNIKGYHSGNALYYAQYANRHLKPQIIQLLKQAGARE